MHRILLLCAVLWTACAQDFPDRGVLVQPAGPGIDPTTDGPFAVGQVADLEAARALRPDVAVELFYPSREDGTLDPAGAPYPAVVFIQGGRVPVEEYRWLAARLASWGFVVALPDYALDLAFFGPQRAPATYELLSALNRDSFLRGGIATTRVAVGGHSLGGVVASGAIERESRFRALFLLGSYPGGRGPVELGVPVLSVAGEDDCLAAPEDVEEGFARFSAPKILARLAGVGHFQFTGDDARDQAECPPGATLEEAHSLTSQVVLPFLFEVLEGDARFTGILDTPPAGISLTRDGL